MREAPGSPWQRATGLFAAVLLGLLLVLFLGPGRGGILALLLLALLPVILPRPRGDRKHGGDTLLRGLLAGILLAGLVAVLLLRSPAALLAAILLLWIVPLAVSGFLGTREEEPR